MTNLRIIPIRPASTVVIPDYGQPYDLTGDGMNLVDKLQRPLRDLRISVTDRCNMRCGYCMPRKVFGDDYAFLPRTELLSFEEIERLAKLFIQLGVQKIRLTGGEPLLRRGIEQLIEKLAKLHTTENQPIDIALTTNATLLTAKARSLKDAGLSRITVSLDALDEKIFRHMSDSDVAVSTVLNGIAAAQRAGFASIKVNMVVKRATNEQEIIPMATHFRDSGIVLRFIEYMDVGSSNGWRMDDVVSAREILQRLTARYELEPLEANYSGEVAARWRYVDGAGEIGVIASVTQAFCHDCTRARLSTDGKMYNCLFASDGGADLQTPLRARVTDAVLVNLIAQHWQQRSDRYSELRQITSPASRAKIEMSYIGG